MAETPEICAGDDFRIGADGTWYHSGAPIRRQALVRLFATVLRRDAEGRYWLVTPAEKVAVQVDDAAFIAVAMAVGGEGPETHITFETNIGARQRLDTGHPLVIRDGPKGPKPYLMLDDGLEALVARSVYYELAERAETGPDGKQGVFSAGSFFPLESS